LNWGHKITIIKIKLKALAQEGPGREEEVRMMLSLDFLVSKTDDGRHMKATSVL
jgi:hypothetical protein